MVKTRSKRREELTGRRQVPSAGVCRRQLGESGGGPKIRVTRPFSPRDRIQPPAAVEVVSSDSSSSSDVRTSDEAIGSQAASSASSAPDDGSFQNETYPTSDRSVSSSSVGVTEMPTMSVRLPRRLFSTDRYPTEGRVNSYSKLQYLLDILSVLSGSTELQLLQASPFWPLFKLPVRQCSLSGKLVHNILCRQLVTKNKQELWFTFGGYPLRFSLAEFQKISGLQCGPYLDKGRIDVSQTPSSSPYWDTLLGPAKDITIEEIVTKLKEEPSMPGWKKLRLSLIVIVEGVLICGTQPIRPSVPVVEMLRDLDSFFSYPWGRHAFENTLRMVHVGNVVQRPSLLLKKLKQRSLVVHGFPISIQLLLFQSIPLLTRYLPHAEDVSPFYDCGMSQLPKLRTYHTHNILEVENDSALNVKHVVALTSKAQLGSGEVSSGGDSHVARMLRLHESGYKFSKEDWHGGDASIEKLCICQKYKNQLCTCSTVDSAARSATPPLGNSHNEAKQEYIKLRKAVYRLQKTQVSMILKLKSDLLAELKILFASHNRGRCGGHVSEPVPDTSMRSSPTSPPSLHTPPTSTPGNPLDAEVNKLSGCKADSSNVPDTSAADMGLSPSANNFCCPTADLCSPPPSVDPCSVLVATSVAPIPDVAIGCSTKHVAVDDRATNFVSGGCTSASLEKEPTGSGHLPPTYPDLQVDDCCPCPENSYAPQVGNPLEKEEPRINSLIQAQPVPDAEFVTKSTHDHAPSSANGSRKRKETEYSIPRVFDLPKPVEFPKGSFSPFRILGPHLVRTFKKKLRLYRKSTYDMDGVAVGKNFFAEIFTLQQWLFRTHMDFMVRPFWRARGRQLAANGIVVLDSLLTQLLCSQFRPGGDCSIAPFYSPDPLLASYVEGTVGDRNEKTMWFRDVHTIYTPMNWGNRHWVCLVICLKSCHIDILDPLVKCNSDEAVENFMYPLMQMLPLMLRATCFESDITHFDFLEWSFSRVEGLPQNERGGDCGAFVIKFIEMHSHNCLPRGMGDFTDEVVKSFRMQYAIDIYEEFVGKLSR